MVTDQAGKPRSGVVITDCRENTRVTNASGYFQFSYGSFDQYCIKIRSLPAYTSRPVATKRRPDSTSNVSYEWQVAGAYCYHNTTYCGPNGLSIKSDIRTTTDDLSPENVFNFSVTYSPPAPPGGGGGGTGGGSTGGGSTGGGTVVRRPTGSSGAPVSPENLADTTAPSTPGDLSAIGDDQTKTVKLSWSASIDNTAVKGYTLERSTDQQTWSSVADTVSDTNFEDNTVTFGSTLYYRVRAFDEAGNTSEYSTAQVTTSEFSANAYANQDSTVDSEDGVVTVLIPSGAISEDAFCGIKVVNNVLSPDIDGYQLASGSYEVSCRKKDGTVLSNFDKTLSTTVKLGSKPLKKAGKLAYYGQKDTNWEKLSVTSHNKKAKTDTVDLSGHQIFTIMKQHKKKSVLLIIFQVFLILALIVGAVLGFLRFKQRRQLQGQYDDYLHKSRGY